MRQPTDSPVVARYSDVAALRRASVTHTDTHHYRSRHMLQTLAIILVILWILGIVTSYTLGGFIHILLVVAVVMVLLRVINRSSKP